MLKRLDVSSRFPNLRGVYVESGSNDGKPTFVLESPSGATWLFHSSCFGRGPCWYFSKALPSRGSMSSLCCSDGDAATPEAARWPADDISEIKDVTHSAVDVNPTEPVSAACEKAVACERCRDLDALSAGLLCPACAKPPVEEAALLALLLLRGHASSATRKHLAASLVNGDLEVKRRLESIAAIYEASNTQQPIILVEPPAGVTIGASTTTLTCEAFSFGESKVTFQWYKNDVPISRAERPRLVLCGASSSDQGTYLCRVSCGLASVCTRACAVTLAESARRFDSPLRRAGEAERAGSLDAAAELLAEAAAAARGMSDTACAGALSRRAELLVRLGRFEPAFRDATEAASLAPGLAASHAARGTAAAKLGLLAEAVSSWETAELLGVQGAAAEAEASRERLRSYFAERRQTTSAGAQGADRASYEDSWRRAGWDGRYAGGSAGGYFGGGGGGRSGAGKPPASELQRDLETLGFEAGAAPPDAEAVRKAYRRLALQLHPDKPGGSKDAFQRLQNAYEAVLGAVGE